MPQKKHPTIKHSQAKSDRNAVKAKHQKSKRSHWLYFHIKAVEYASFAVSGLLGLTLSAMANTSMSAAVWTTCAAVIFAAIGGACWWQKYLWDKDAGFAIPEPVRVKHEQNSPSPTPEHSQASVTQTVDSVEFPKFCEEASAFTISYGDKLTFTIPKERVTNEPSYLGMVVFGMVPPVKIYKRGDHFMADVEVGVGNMADGAKILLRGNKLEGKPSNWDCNFNDQALEIIDEKLMPVFQFYYKSKTHIVMNGIFQLSDGSTWVIPDGFILGSGTISPTAKLKCSAVRIFEYPASFHRGVLRNTASTP